MRMVRLAMVVFLTALVAVCSAQPAWRKAWSVFYDGRNSMQESAEAVAPAHDSGAYSATWTGPIQGGQDDSGYHLTKVDQNGNLQWSTLLNLEASPALSLKVVEGMTGVYVAASVNKMWPSGYSILVAKYDFWGQPLWQRFYTLDSGYFVMQLLVDSRDAPIVLAGVPPLPDSGADTLGWLMVKYDYSGSFKWVVHPTLVPKDHTDYIQTDGGQNIYVSGGDDKGTSWLEKLGKDGGTLWSYTEDTGEGDADWPYFAVGADTTVYLPVAYTYPTGGGRTYLRRISSGGQLLSSGHVEAQGLNHAVVDPFGNAYLFPGPGVLAKFSTNSTLLWQKNVPTGGFDGFVDPNGNLDLFEGDPTDVNQSPFQVEQFDANGNSKWKSFLVPSGFGLHAISHDSTGIITGGSGGLQAAIQKSTFSGAAIWTYGNITNNRPGANIMYASTTPSGITYFMGNDGSGPSSPRWLGAVDANGKLLFNKAPAPESLFFLQACPDGGCLVGQRSLRKIDQAGNVLWTVPISGQAAVINSNGEIYVSGGGVTKLSSNGSILWQSGAGGGNVIRLDPFGNVIMVGPVKISPDGVTLTPSISKTAPAFINGPATIDSDSKGNLYEVYNTYTQGTTYGAVNKYSPDGTFISHNELGFSLNCPEIDAICDRTTDTLYVASTGYSGFYQPVIFGVDCATNLAKWRIAIPNIGSNARSRRILLNANHHLVVAGDRHDNNQGYDWYIVQLSPKGAIEQVSDFDSGFKLNDRYDTFNMDASSNAYMCGRSVGPTGTYDFTVVKYSIPLLDDANVVVSARPNMLAGTVYPITVTATNTGTEDWTAATGFTLDCLQASTWGVISQKLATNQVIGPTEVKQWIVNVTTPSTPGTYQMQWRMDKSGTLFGSPSPLLTITVVPQTNFAAFVSQSIPSSMVCGQSYPVTLQYKNTGTNTWYPSTIRLQSAAPADNLIWGMSRLPLTNGPVPPGSTGIFAATIFGPDNPGTYTMQWQPIDESTGLNFSLPSEIVSVQVVKKADAARYYSRTGALTVLAGGDFYIQNTMFNVGTNNWTSSGGYSMMTANPLNDTKWTATRAYMPPGSSITPDSPATFTALCTAPITPGTYSMQWQCDRNGVPFGDLTPLLNITVVTSPDNAQYVSQSPMPTNIGINYSFPFTFAMKNIGTATWDSSYSLVPVGTSGFGVSSIPCTGTVAPGATASFNATFSAPTTPGTYTFQWRMVHNGVKFGQRTLGGSIIVSTEAGVFVSSNIPATVYAGQDFWIQYTMKNTGATTWTSSGGYSMMSANPLNNTTFGINRLYMPAGSSIAPLSTTSFNGLATAPIVAKTYATQWQLDKNGTPFGDITPFLNINVINGPDNAQFVSQADVATNILHGTPFFASVTMQNLGTATWGAGYTLVPVGSSNFGIGSIGASSTGPGATCTFSQEFIAPSTTGTYTFQWRMAHNGVKFGQKSVAVTVIVN